VPGRNGPGTIVSGTFVHGSQGVIDEVATLGAVGRLFVVSTPIGNLEDISYRAVETLRSVKAILAEDTRHSRTLLDRYGIATSMVPYHEHNEAKSTPALVARLMAGDDLALISDAGTPLLSDPGARLIAGAIAAGVPVVPVPGASAMLAGLVASGLDATRFTFYGFLPRKGRERTDAIAELSTLRHTAVLYEAPSRVAETLGDLAKATPERPVVVARELTKQFEEVRRGTLAGLAAYYADSPPRGEVVIMVAGVAVEVASEDSLRARARELRESGATARDVVASLVAEAGASRNLAYRIAHE
jgi:16S rRNA (cytidine1402-2'-O)-methyltransferase